MIKRVAKGEIKREIKIYKPKRGEPFPYKIVTNGTPGRVFIFRTNKEKDTYNKEEDEKRLKSYQEWRKERNKECFQRFLKEFGMTKEKIEKMFGLEGLNLLLNEDFFINFYYPPEFSETEDGNWTIGGKSLTKEKREEFLAAFFKKIMAFEAKKWASVYNLDWEDLYQEFELKLFKTRGTYDVTKGANLFTYYRFIIGNRAKDLKGAELKRLTYSIEEKQEEGIEFPDVSLNEFKNLNLELVIEKLTPKQKGAIKLVFLEDLTKEKASKRLGISIDSLNDRLDGAFKKLRELLTP